MDNFTNEMSEKLVQYLDGTLAGTEKELLEQQLATDIALQAELTSLQATREAVRLYGLNQKVSGIHKKMMEEMKPPVRQLNSGRKLLRYAVAIAASVILVIAGYMTYNFYNLSSEKVFAANFQSYELVTNRGTNTVESSIIKTFKEKKYNDVISIVYDSGFTTEEEFVRGMAFAELKKNESAIVAFKKVLELNKLAATPIYNDEAEYYLGLIYVRNKQYDKALEILNKISAEKGHLYYEKVTGKLIGDVKKLSNK